MALLFADSFDHAASGAAVLTKWTAGSGYTVSATYARHGPRGITVSAANSYLSKALPPASTMIVGLALRPGVVGARDSFAFRQGGSHQVYVRRNANGSLSVHRGDGAVLGSTPILVYKADTWLYVELKVVVANAGGRAILRVDENVLVDYTGDTQATATAEIDELYLYNSGNDDAVDDLVVMDTAGTRCNDFLGDVNVSAHVADAAGALAEWTPLASTNVSQVDDPLGAHHDADSTYNSSATAGQRDLFGLSDLAPAGAAVKAVVVQADLRKDDAGARSARTLVRTGGANFAGATEAVSNSYVGHRTTYEANPDTGADWTVAEVNALEAGYELVS